MTNENRFFVGARGFGDDAQIVVMLPPIKPITKDDAVNLAAWLVAVADPLRETFDRVITEVMDT